jgi:DNA-binding HxlR family transcriptional regulator
LVDDGGCGEKVGCGENPWWDRARDAGACESRRTLDLIGDKWSLLVIALLGDRTRRFSELKRQIDGISQRMLTLTLRQLEREGLVRRTVYAEVPPRVEYELSSVGGTLLATVQQLVEWALAHRDELAESRTRYDQAHPSEPSDKQARRVVR